MGRERGATSKETEPKFLCSILCIFQMHIWLSRWKWRVGIQTQHLFTIYDSYPVHRYFTLSQSRPTAGKAYTGLWGQNKVLGWSHCSLLRCSAGFRTQLEKVIIFAENSWFFMIVQKITQCILMWKEQAKSRGKSCISSNNFVLCSFPSLDILAFL